MKTKMRYSIFIIVILIISASIPVMVTHARYISKVSMEKNISIGTMVFNVKQAEGEENPYELTENGEVALKYIISNVDDDNNINKLDLKYYFKIIDSNGNEVDDLQITVDGYNYIKYKVDEDGNIINEDGNIVNEDGELILDRQLTEEENEEVQENLVEVKKGYGPINLSYDGQTIDEKELNITIRCPAGYSRR